MSVQLQNDVSIRYEAGQRIGSKIVFCGEIDAMKALSHTLPFSGAHNAQTWIEYPWVRPWFVQNIIYYVLHNTGLYSVTG